MQIVEVEINIALFIFHKKTCHFLTGEIDSSHKSGKGLFSNFLFYHLGEPKVNEDRFAMERTEHYNFRFNVQMHDVELVH